ncbi:MAG TPA: glycoside hydrolase [Solibacterales bacterium]|nr:glycoside hydrolase [Bryobacterales bacterium]
MKLRVLLMLTPMVLVAQYGPSKIPALTVGERPAELRVTPLSDAAVRVTVHALDSAGAPVAVRNEPVLGPRSWPAAAFRLRSKAIRQSGKAGAWSVVSDGEFLELTPPGQKTLRFDFAPDGAVAFRRGEKPVYGLGQGGPQFDRRGHLYTPRNDHGAYNLAKLGGRLPIPLLVSTEGWALFFHLPIGTIDLREPMARFTPGDGPGPLDFFVLAGDGPRIFREYAGITGQPSLPPLWTFGYQQSHRTLRDFDEVLWVAKSLREKKLPTDVLIYLGTGWCPSGWNQGHDSFDFNPKVFNDPVKQLAQLKALNFRVVMHSTYPPRRLFGSVRDESSTGDENEARKYWERHRPVSKMGIDGWWPDAAENLTVEGRLARIQMYYEGPQTDHPDQRPYALHRTGYAGMQRMGGWLWSGDVDSTWETLRNHLPIALNTAMSGVPHWGTDIGGFYPTPEYTAEYYVRWFQFMAFTPLFRSHGRTWYSHTPFAWNLGVLGPDEMENSRAGRTPVTAEMMKNPRVEPICRRYMEARYRLMPYIYTMARETHETGIPMIRPLWLHYPDDEEGARRDDVFLWGRDMLVAPVVEKDATRRSLYLPRGSWYDFWNGEKTEGGRAVDRPVDLETMPVYVRAGAVVPMSAVKQHTGEASSEPLTLRVFPGADGAASLYEDDGLTFAHERGVFQKFEMVWNDRTRVLTIRAGRGSKPGPARKFNVELAGGPKKTVTFTGRSLPVAF